MSGRYHIQRYAYTITLATDGVADFPITQAQLGADHKVVAGTKSAFSDTTALENIACWIQFPSTPTGNVKFLITAGTATTNNITVSSNLTIDTVPHKVFSEVGPIPAADFAYNVNLTNQTGNPVAVLVWWVALCRQPNG
jgi:hypothetical protein